MDWYLSVAFLLSLFVIIFLLDKLRRVKKQLSAINEILADIKGGNLNRRILTDKQDITQKICYSINEIVMDSQTRLIRHQQSGQAYKRLMTSLSHDVKTPLTSLLGYLEAVENKIVVGAEKDDYIRIALNKARSLKDFVYSLFEWVKLDVGEQLFHFEVGDINELSRNIIADWIPILENHQLSYSIHIPEEECAVRMDISAFTRMIENLLQNIINHSGANQVEFHLAENEKQVMLTVADNGKGISENDLPHIFERMYTGDSSRSVRGNGLGLSITRELVNHHQGTITAASLPGVKTSFIIILPRTV